MIGEHLYITRKGKIYKVRILQFTLSVDRASREKLKYGLSFLCEFENGFVEELEKVAVKAMSEEHLFTHYYELLKKKKRKAAELAKLADSIHQIEAILELNKYINL